MSIVRPPTSSPDRSGRRRLAVPVVLILTALVACTPLPGEPGGTTAPPTTAATTSTVVLPTTSTTVAVSTSTSLSVTTTSSSARFDALVSVPEGPGPFPAVVLVHGGSWVAGSPRSLEPLARHLAASGYLVVNTRYRLASLEVPSFPQALHDIACAVRHAAHHPASDGSVTLIGHSAGAHLAAVVALTGDTYGEECDDPVVATADRLVGLAGPYDIVQLGVLAAPLFGVAPSEDPDLWASGNPMSLIGPETDVAVLLLHGDDDTVVSVRFSESFAEALESAGFLVDLQILTDVTHMTVTDPTAIGDTLVGWLADN